MRKLKRALRPAAWTLHCCALLLALAVCWGCGNGDGSSDGEAARDVGPQDLSPEYADGQTWRETINADSSRMGKVTWTAAARLAKTPEGRITIDYTGIDLGTALQKTVKDGRLHCTVDDKLLLKDGIDSKGFRNAWLAIPTFLEEQSILGYLPPSEKVAVGDTWSTGDLVPFGMGTFELLAKDVKGALRFERVATEAGVRVAHLVWDGEAQIGKKSRKGKRTMPITWTRRIEFDLERRRVLRYESRVKVVQGSSVLTNDVTRKFVHAD